jgi:hypothetical protein
MKAPAEQVGWSLRSSAADVSASRNLPIPSFSFGERLAGTVAYPACAKSACGTWREDRRQRIGSRNVLGFRAFRKRSACALKGRSRLPLGMLGPEPDLRSGRPLRLIRPSEVPIKLASSSRQAHVALTHEGGRSAKWPHAHPRRSVRLPPDRRAWRSFVAECLKPAIPTPVWPAPEPGETPRQPPEKNAPAAGGEGEARHTNLSDASGLSISLTGLLPAMAVRMVTCGPWGTPLRFAGISRRRSCRRRRPLLFLL